MNGDVITRRVGAASVKCRHSMPRASLVQIGKLLESDAEDLVFLDLPQRVLGDDPLVGARHGGKIEHRQTGTRLGHGDRAAERFREARADSLHVQPGTKDL